MELMLCCRHSVVFLQCTSVLPSYAGYIRTALRASSWDDAATDCLHITHDSSYTLSFHIANTCHEGENWPAREDPCSTSSPGDGGVYVGMG